MILITISILKSVLFKLVNTLKIRFEPSLYKIKIFLIVMMVPKVIDK